MSTISTSSMRKLPPTCYAMLDGRPVIIRKGASEADPAPMLTEQAVHWRNYNLGITPEQVTGMINGLVFGWDHPSIDPGPMPLHRYTVAVPLISHVEVEAYSTTDAVEQAHRLLTMPATFEFNGSPLITRKH